MKKIFQQYKMQLALVAYGILTVKLFYNQMSNGLDSSWIYALNKFTAFDNIKFGRDLIFTYGPLGFLAYPMYMNGNFIIGVFLNGLIWSSSIVLFYKLLKDKRQNIGVVCFSLFIMYLGCPAYDGNLFIQYCILLALAVLWVDMNDKFATVFVVLVTTVAFFYKASIIIPIIGTYFLFLVSKLILKEKKRIWVLFLPCVTIPICYLIYHPSIYDFLRFIKGNWEISKGFNVAMSTSYYDRYVFWMFALMIIYIAIMISQLVYKKEKNFFCMLWLAPCLYMSYKHGYVRADGHTILAYIELLATFSILILLFEYEDVYKDIVQKSKKGMLQGTLILALLIVTFMDYNTGIQPWITMRSRIQELSSAFYFMTEKRNEENIDSLTGIPDTIYETIGDSTFTSFPWEITFIEKGRKLDDDTIESIASNFIPLFTIQAYSAYTPYLDRKTGNIFYGSGAPEYIIFRFDTIDGRLPLLEVPFTWKSIDDNYEIALFDSDTGYFLLKHKQNTTYRGESVVSDKVFDKEDVITFDGCSEIRIYADLSLGGELMNFIWKIPAVNAKITYTNGVVREGRVLLDNLSNGIEVSGIPYDYDTLNNAMSGGGESCALESIEFSGEGLDYYKDEIVVEYIYY